MGLERLSVLSCQPVIERELSATKAAGDRASTAAVVRPALGVGCCRDGGLRAPHERSHLWTTLRWTNSPEPTPVCGGSGDR